MRDEELFRALDGGVGADVVDMAAERAVVGAVLRDPRLDGPVAVGLTMLRAADFGSVMRDAWAAVERCVARREAPTLDSVCAELRAQRKLEVVGGRFALEECTREASPAWLEQHARLVAQGGMVRRLRDIGERLAIAAKSGTRDPVALRALALESLSGVRVPSTPPTGIIDGLDAVFVDLERRLSGMTESFIPTTITAVDEKIAGGLRTGLYLVVARPGVGKTTLTLAMAAGQAKRGDAVAYVSLEQSLLECMQSLLCAEARVSLERFTRFPRVLTADDSQALNRAANTIASWPLHLIADVPETPDAPARLAPRRVAEIAATIAKLPARVRCVYLDHVGELRATRDGAEMIDAQREIAADLRDLAKHHTQCPVVALAHAKRQEPDRRGLYSRPSAESIYGGDALYKVAHGCFVLHREDKYPTRAENVGSQHVAGVVDVLVPKFRGVQDNRYAQLRFIGDEQRFESHGASAFRAAQGAMTTVEEFS